MAAAAARALLTKHETVSVLTSLRVGGQPRWQRIFVLFTGFLCQLVVCIWLFYSRALSCCADVRGLLGCGSDPLAPCAGFGGKILVPEEARAVAKMRENRAFGPQSREHNRCDRR